MQLQLTINDARNNRGQSTTDVSSIPQTNSNREMEQLIEAPYIEVRLTKEVLNTFELQTKISTNVLIREYLYRCSLVAGEIDGLLILTSSSSDLDDSSSENED